MIKFILLLPFKIIGLLFMIIGATLDGVNRRRIEQEKQAEKQQRELERIARIENARIEKEKRERARLDRQAQADRRRAEKEKQAQADRLERKRKQAEKERAAQAVKAQKAADRRKAETFKADQARTDIEHYKIQRSELLKLYNELEKQFEQAATDRQKEIVFRKQIALNNQIRGVDRQIEKAQYTINKSGPA